MKALAKTVVDYLAAPLAVELAQSLERIALSDQERLEGIVTITKAATQLRRAYPTVVRTREELEDEKEEAELQMMEEELTHAECSLELKKRVLAAREAAEAERAPKKAAREAKKQSQAAEAMAVPLEMGAGKEGDPGPDGVNQGESSLIKVNQAKEPFPTRPISPWFCRWPGGPAILVFGSSPRGLDWG